MSLLVAILTDLLSTSVSVGNDERSIYKTSLNTRRKRPIIKYTVESETLLRDARLGNPITSILSRLKGLCKKGKKSRRKLPLHDLGKETSRYSTKFLKGLASSMQLTCKKKGEKELQASK